MMKAAPIIMMCALVACEASGPPLVESESLPASSQADLVIDEKALADSIRFEAGQNVQPGEVQDGCAAAISDRSLVRFDLRVENVGQKDIDFGEVSCTSTNPAAECFGRVCRDQPSCCCGGQSLCTATGGGQSDFFTFSCGHRDVNFRSSAKVELVNSAGAVVKKRLLGVLLRDRENLAGDGDCATKNPSGFGEIGLHAGCAADQPSVVGCQYLDVTGLPSGNYSLRVSIDAIKAVSEASETNNTASAGVQIGGGQPSAERTRPVYLVCYGDGPADEGIAYYSGLKPGGFVAGAYSLDDWIGDFMDGKKQVEALYRNANELSFWREMHCTESIGRDAGGCWVRNWATLKDFQKKTPNLGTVAMRLDEDGVTQFFVFGPDGKLTPQAILDDEGPKTIPRLCVNCHGGSYLGPEVTDLGSVFREFEPSLLDLRPGLSLKQADEEFFKLNQVVKSANLAVKSEAEGAPFGVDAAKEAMDRYVTDMYPAGQKRARSVRDPAHVPASWKDGFSPTQKKLNEELWMHMVSPYCMSCHRDNLINWEDYGLFQGLGPPFNSLKGLIVENPEDPDRTQQIFMPQSKLSWSNMVNDAEAMIAMERWLAHDESAPLAGDEPEPSFHHGGGDVHARFLGRNPPVAVAMHESEARPRQVVVLDARKSFDPDGQKVVTAWRQIMGPEVTLFSTRKNPVVRFVTPPVTQKTAVGFLLTVTDGGGSQTERYVEVAVSPG